LKINNIYPTGNKDSMKKCEGVVRREINEEVCGGEIGWEVRGEMGNGGRGMVVSGVLDRRCVRR
jgi:hypothetical protein